jgi:hypothetical protein
MSAVAGSPMPGIDDDQAQKRCLGPPGREVGTSGVPRGDFGVFNPSSPEIPKF